MLIGIDIGGTTCSVTKATCEVEILQTKTIATQSASQTLEWIFESIKAMQPGNTPYFGVACGGPLDPIGGIIMEPPNLPGWVDIPIIDQLVKQFGGCGQLMNDGDACALAEWQFGAGKGTRHMVFITFGTGFGAGLILNGQRYQGASNDAGEIGHIRLAPQGPIGYGKAGSIEGFCSGGGIRQVANTFAVQRHLKTLFGREIDKISAKDIALAASKGDRDALELMDQTGSRLGEALAIIIDLLNPECIVLGGIFMRCHELLTPSMNRVLKQECLPPSLAACRIVPAALGEMLGIYSALTVARQLLDKMMD